jgi:hypothetical protein
VETGNKLPQNFRHRAQIVILDFAVLLGHEFLFESCFMSQMANFEEFFSFLLELIEGTEEGILVGARDQAGVSGHNGHRTHVWSERAAAEPNRHFRAEPEGG